jgi:hypothetical protein
MGSHAGFDSSVTGFCIRAKLMDITGALNDDVCPMIQFFPRSFRVCWISDYTYGCHGNQEYSADSRQKSVCMFHDLFPSVI